MNSLGLREQDFEEEPPEVVQVWSINWEAFKLFRRMRTQWRMGMSGIYGLDYNVLFHIMDRLNLNNKEYEELEHNIRIMEGAVLQFYNQKSAQRAELRESQKAARRRK